MGQTTTCQLWRVLGRTLLLAAFIVLISVSIQSQALPRLVEMNTPHDAAIHNLNNVYPWLAGSGLIAGLVGLLALTAGRPVRWPHFRGRPRRWARAKWLGGLALGIFITMWLPWRVSGIFLGYLIGPLLTLIFFTSATAVQVTLWWWIRRQTGHDQHAWGAALVIQGIALVVTLVFVLIASAVIADTPAADNGFVLLMLPVSHPILLFVGAVLSSQTLGEDSPIAAQTTNGLENTARRCWRVGHRDRSRRSLGSLATILAR